MEFTRSATVSWKIRFRRNSFDKSGCLRYKSPRTYPSRSSPRPRRRPADRVSFFQEVPMSFVIALDQGTTSSRAIIFDAAGRIVASAQKEFRQIYPRPGWVEHDPREIWESQVCVALLALKQ